MILNNQSLFNIIMPLGTSQRKFFSLFNSQLVPNYFLRILWLVANLFLQKFNVFAKSPDQPPNIIIILADDLGYGDLGGYYGGKSKTPHLNQLAKEGMLFTDFHANGPSCSPTRASLLTGRYPQRMGVETPQLHVLDLPENQNEITIARYLSAAGYYNGIIGKWHLGRPPKGNPLLFGFDKFIGYYGGDLDYFSKIDRYGKKDWWHNEDLLEEEGYATQLITKHSVQFIKDHKDKPFFLYVPHLAVHFPWQEPDDGNLEVRQEGIDYSSSNIGKNSKLGPHYPDTIPGVLNRMIEELDKSVGTIIRTLRDYKIDNNTLVFFMSDNGQYTNYEELWPQVGSNNPLRGQKGDVWEGGHRVPAIAWWPDHIPPLSATDQTVMTMDIVPTILDLLHIKTPTKNGPNQLDGISILPLLVKRNETLKSRELFWRVNTNKAVRRGPWKLVVQDKSFFLFNLSEDISESKDLFSKNPILVKRMKKSLLNWEKSVSN